MTREQTKALLDEAERLFASENKLIRLESGRAVFVGDTHGDLEATEKVIGEYLGSGNKLVFLGDYVDRGPASLENINFLLARKLEHPDSLYLLMGNHEGYALFSFYPADFWEGLDSELRQRYGEVLSGLPLAVSTPNGIIALHGALPDVPSLADINKIKPGSAEWHQITWGDCRERAGKFLGRDPNSGRPQFGKGWFEKAMRALGENVLIRSHQPDAPAIMYDRRCLTIFTSSAYRNYGSQRTVALIDLDKVVQSVDDLQTQVI